MSRRDENELSPAVASMGARLTLNTEKPGRMSAEVAASLDRIGRYIDGGLRRNTRDFLLEDTNLRLQLERYPAGNAEAAVLYLTRIVPLTSSLQVERINQEGLRATQEWLPPRQKIFTDRLDEQQKELLQQRTDVLADEVLWSISAMLGKEPRSLPREAQEMPAERLTGPAGNPGPFNPGTLPGAPGSVKGR